MTTTLVSHKILLIFCAAELLVASNERLYTTEWSRVLLENLIIPRSSSKKFLAFCETPRSITLFTKPATFSYSEPTQINPVHAIPTDFFKMILVLSSHLRLGFQVVP